MSEAEQQRDDNSSATPAEVERLKQALRHGYRWGDEVLRPARVRVAQ